MNSESIILRRAKANGFLLFIIIAVFLAWLYPFAGVSNEGQVFSLERISYYGVSVIFFFYGLSLNVNKLWEQLKDWRVHVVVQSATFLLFPLIIFAAEPIALYYQADIMWLGIFYVAALPSTVSSSVVMVSLAGGNIPSAIFNASISSLLGIFITPFWMGLMLTDHAVSFDPTSVLVKLILQVLLPVILGMLLHHRLGTWAMKHKARLKFFDQSVIILIIYTSFCQSFYEGAFEKMSMLSLVLLGAMMILLFAIVFFLLSWISRLFSFSREDQITVVFCGSKKSLVHGTVMSKVLFASHPLAGAILLPLMLYHALQLMLASIIAEKMKKNN